MFVGKDVATALGYSNTSKAIQQHVDHEDKGILPIRETAYETRAVCRKLKPLSDGLTFLATLG